MIVSFRIRSMHMINLKFNINETVLFFEACIPYGF